MIRLKHIYKSYTLGEVDVPVLKNVSLHVKPREFVSILGPSGSGKSTLMNIIGCLDIPDSGDYILDGEYVDSCTEDELSEIRGIKIGFIFQQFHLLPDLTAYENVEMPLLYHKISQAERHKRVMKTLGQVGLEVSLQLSLRTSRQATWTPPPAMKLWTSLKDYGMTGIPLSSSPTISMWPIRRVAKYTSTMAF